MRIWSAEPRISTATRGQEELMRRVRSEVQGPPVQPRLALSKAEAARALGVSVDFFDDHIARELRVVSVGRRRLYLVVDLERWLDEHAEGSVAA